MTDHYAATVNGGDGDLREDWLPASSPNGHAEHTPIPVEYAEATWFVDGKFIPRQLAQALAGEAPVAKGGQQLYVYTGGAYRPGEEHLARRVTDVLGDDWRTNRANEVLGFLRASSAELWEAPPRDRVNVANGILDLRTGALEQHTPEFLSPVQLAAAYDPHARCPAVDQFLETVIGADTAAVFYELAGYLTTPDNSFQRAFMLQGPGGNGKSKALDLLRALLGPANVSAVALHVLEEDRFATADLYGRLANIFADLDARALRSSSVFKSITGGDAIRAERKHRDSFTFVPYARLIFSANQPPPTSDSSLAFFDRWIVLPFERRIRGTADEDPEILAKLTTPAELSGLLNRALARLNELRARGRFTTTDATRAAGNAFRQEADTVTGFVAECCTFRPDARCPRPTVYAAYNEWARDGNRHAIAAQRFNRRLQELASEGNHPLELRPIQGVRYWLGIELTDGAR